MNQVKKIYYVQHDFEQDGYDFVTEIGVFSTEEKAKEIVEKLKNHPKFETYKNGFSIQKYTIDDRKWTEGFFTFE